MAYLLLLVSLGIILMAAEIFTNGVEWLGLKLRLSEGAVGSILAAVGTALPESLIPLIAFVTGKGVEQQHIGIGAIIGAPFMLSTLAFFICGVMVVLERKKRIDFPYLRVDPRVIRRDLLFFIGGYSLGLSAAFVQPEPIKKAISVLLFSGYVVYVLLTLRGGRHSQGQSIELSPLIFSRSGHNPRLILVAAQLLFSLALLVGGAQLFIKNVAVVSEMLGIPSFFLSLIIAPIATELPEKFNSIIWLRREKDTLALGNITGAMVFQSIVLPSIGILFTDWRLIPGSEIPILLTYASTGLAFLSLQIKKKLNAYVLLTGALFYLVFLWTTLH